MHAVFVGADLNSLSVLPTPEPTSPYFMVDTPWAPLTTDEARFVGDPIAMVVADDRYIAEDAIELVDVEYEPLPPLVSYEDDGLEDRLVHEHLGSNSSGEFGVGMEEIEAVIGAAPHVVEHTIHQQAYAAVPMENAWGGRRLLAFDGRVHDLRVLSVAARGAGVRVAPARDAAAPDPRDHEGHRRRLRPEDLHAAGGVGRRPRRRASSGSH